MALSWPLRRYTKAKLNRRKASPSKHQIRRPLFETLELRRVLATYTWGDLLGTLAIQLGTNESLTITESGGTATFTLSTGTFTQIGGDPAPGTGTGALAIPTGDLDSSIAIDNSISAGGVNNVIFNGTGSLTSASIEVELSDSDAVGTVAIQDSFDLVSNGAGGVSLTSDQGVFVDTGTSISTGDGDIVLSGNANGSSVGNFNGVVINGTLNSTGAGDILAVGHGANGSGSDRQRGVFVFGGQIHSTGTGAISLSGVGGNGGTDNNVGISLESNAQVTSVAGDITIYATGGNGSTTQNAGLVMVSGADIVATGEADVSVTGIGGSGTDQAIGVVLIGSDVGISAVDGDIEISGTATDAGSANTIGVWLTSSATVTTSGDGNLVVTGQSAQTVVPGIQIDGSAVVSVGGATATFIADGISVATGSTINAAQSAVILKTKTKNGSVGINIGGSDSATQLGVSNAELNRITAGAIVIGDDDTPNTIVVSDAIQHLGDADISVVTGRNISLASGSSWTTVDGDLDFVANRQSIATPGNFAGVAMDAATMTSNGEGRILLQGRGGNTGLGNYGVSLGGGAVIQSTAAASGAGTISLDGVGGSSNQGNLGVQISGAGTTITAVAGDILINGRGGNGATFAHTGVQIEGGAVISSTGTDSSAAEIKIVGIAGVGTSNNVGVNLFDLGTQITSVNGNISIAGTGGGNGTGPSNTGIFVQSSVVVSSTGTGANAASITIHGVGGNGLDTNQGVSIFGSSSITSIDGSIAITAIEGTNTVVGLQVQDSATVSATGAGVVTLAANGMDIEAAVSAPQSTVNLLPVTAGFNIDLGGADSATQLGLTDAELDQVTAASLIIGSVQAGTINVSADITRLAPTDMTLSAGGDIVFSAGQVSTFGGNLRLDAPVSGKVVSPTKAGADATANNVTVNADLGIVINGTTVNTDYNQLNIVGAVLLPFGNLVLSGSYVPQPGDVFTIVAANDVVGQFNDLNNGDTVLFNGVALTISYNAQTITLEALRDAGDIIAIGAAAGAQPRVKVIDARTGDEIVSFLAYDSGFTGGVRVAVADLNSDGQAEIIVAPGAGMSTLVKVFDLDGNEVLGYRTKAYKGFQGGVFVVAGDVNGDGRPDLITSPGSGLSSQIKVFKNRVGIASPNTDPISDNPVYAFLAFGPSFTGGATVAAGNLVGDGKAEIVVGNGAGMAPRVRVFDVSALTPPVSNNLAPFTLEIRPFESTDRGGVFVAVGNTRGDAANEIIVGNGVNGRGRVEIYHATGERSKSFTAYGAADGRNAPVHVAAKNVDPDALDEIITGQGIPDSSRKLRSFYHDGTLIDDVLEEGDDFEFGFFVA